MEVPKKIFRNLLRRDLQVRLLTLSIATILLLSQNVSCFTFIQNSSFPNRVQSSPTMIPHNRQLGSSTQLSVKWFGGGWKDSANKNDGELLGVKIERTSPNSRRIAGEIIISKSMDDVWAILTDYDNLAIHVPNLVESKRLNAYNRMSDIDNSAQQGDGTYKCRLFQKGAQKIIGFEFGASVTMDMTENIRLSNVVPSRVLKLGNEKKIQVGEQRRIYFKCVESQFFSEFDGEWKCSWIDDPTDAFELATKVEYVVDVRPRGPVPVQALEWRIREDVPTNLRAVKVASMNLGKEGVLKLREKNGQQVVNAVKTASRSPVRSMSTVTSSGDSAYSDLTTRQLNSRRNNMRQAINESKGSEIGRKKLASIHVQWYDDETMATYLDKRTP